MPNISINNGTALNKDTKMCGHAESLSRQLLGLNSYGAEKYISLNMCTPQEKDIDIGSDWEYSLPDEILSILLVNWMEQIPEETIHWLPVILFRLLTETPRNLYSPFESFAMYVCRSIDELYDLSQQEFGADYTILISKACRLAMDRWAPFDEPYHLRIGLGIIHTRFGSYSLA